MMNITSMEFKIRGRLQGIKQRFIYYSHKLHIGHPYLALAIVTALIFDYLVFFMTSTGFSITLLVYTILCIIFVVFPKIGSVISVLIYLVLGYYNLLDLQYVFAIIIVSFASISYLLSRVVIAVISIMTISIVMLNSANSNTATVLMAVVSVSLLIGYVCRIHNESIISRQRYMNRIAVLHQREMAHRNNLLIAERMHDSIANDLSYIAMVANAQSGDLWKTIAVKADEAFSATHDIIGLLNDEEKQDVLFHSSSIIDLIARERAALSLIGCHGICDCSEFDDEVINSGVRSVLADVIKEVFGNIRKHADYSSHYSFTLRLNSQHSSRHPIVELSQSNVMASQEARYSKGRGLEILRRELGNVNGDMRIAKSGNMWRMHITIAG